MYRLFYVFNKPKTQPPYPSIEKKRRFYQKDFNTDFQLVLSKYFCPISVEISTMTNMPLTPVMVCSI